MLLVYVGHSKIYSAHKASQARRSVFSFGQKEIVVSVPLAREPRDLSTAAHAEPSLDLTRKSIAHISKMSKYGPYY